MNNISNLPFLIDFDGVVRIGEKPALYSNEFLTYIKDKRIPSFFLSNSTLRTGEDLRIFLKSHHLPYDFRAMTTVDATLNYVSQHYSRIAVYCIEKVKSHFSKLIDNNNPEAVVIGDLGKSWSFEIINDIFLKVKNGSDLIAMHKNKFWLPDGENFQIDAGAFISAIEFSTEKKAILIGKPSPVYFHSALKQLGLPNYSEFIMLGDDIESDINAAQSIRGKGILIYTGKTKFPLANDYNPKPDYEAQNLKDVIRILERIYL
jgi:HAD superfamily hydrolase (TIGR01458 family)